MIGIGRCDDQDVGIRETRDEDSRVTGRDDHHLVAHAGLSEYLGKTGWRERLRKPSCLDCKTVWRAM
jgi:hypothetical protein